MFNRFEATIVFCRNDKTRNQVINQPTITLPLFSVKLGLGSQSYYTHQAELNSQLTAIDHNGGDHKHDKKTEAAVC